MGLRRKDPTSGASSMQSKRLSKQSSRLSRGPSVRQSKGRSVRQSNAEGLDEGELEQVEASVVVAMVVSREDQEATCTGWVLQKLLATAMNHEVEIADTPDNLIDGNLPKHLVVLLSQGVLKVPAFAAVVTAAAKAGYSLLPVLVDGGFAFPTSDFWQALATGHMVNRDVLAEFGATLDEVVVAYKVLFSASAVHFSAKGSVATQRTEAKTIAKRLVAASTSGSGEAESARWEEMQAMVQSLGLRESAAAVSAVSTGGAETSSANVAVPVCMWV